MARQRFQPVITRARFDAPGFSPEQMIQLADALNKSIQARMDRGQDIYDAAAPPLSPNYAKFKAKRYGSTLRDLKATGRTRRGMRTTKAGQNTATLGFVDPIALLRVKFNNKRSRQWGISPRNQQELYKAFQDLASGPVRVVLEKTG